MHSFKAHTHFTIVAYTIDNKLQGWLYSDAFLHIDKHSDSSFILPGQGDSWLLHDRLEKLSILATICDVFM